MFKTARDITYPVRWGGRKGGRDGGREGKRCLKHGDDSFVCCRKKRGGREGEAGRIREQG